MSNKSQESKAVDAIADDIHAFLVEPRDLAEQELQLRDIVYMPNNLDPTRRELHVRESSVWTPFNASEIVYREIYRASFTPLTLAGVYRWYDPSVLSAAMGYADEEDARNHARACYDMCAAARHGELLYDMSVTMHDQPLGRRHSSYTCNIMQSTASAKYVVESQPPLHKALQNWIDHLLPIVERYSSASSQERAYNATYPIDTKEIVHIMQATNQDARSAIIDYMEKNPMHLAIHDVDPPEPIMINELPDLKLVRNMVQVFMQELVTT